MNLKKARKLFMNMRTLILVILWFSLSLHAMESGKELALKSGPKNYFEKVPEPIVSNISDLLGYKDWNAFLRTCKRFLHIGMPIFLSKEQYTFNYNSPIFVAGRYGILWFIEKNKASININGKRGENLLHTIVLLDKIEVVQFLLKHGISVNHADNCGNTPLHDAAYRDEINHGEIVKLLIAHKAMINIQNKSGETPLHMASQRAFDINIEHLLEAGADVNLKDENGKTPRQIREKLNIYGQSPKEKDRIINLMKEKETR